jgi:tetratricopeptide (TPR) repeat protein
MFAVFDEMLAMSRRVGNYRLECWTLGWDSIYALRYHSAERALFKRQGALLLAEEFALEYDRAWSAQELGDIYRVMGEAATARHWFDTARPMFEQQAQEMGVAFHRRGLGDLALARGEWSEAHDHYSAYLEWAVGRDTWSHIYALCGASRAEIALDRREEALGRLREALHMAVGSGRLDTIPMPVAGLAHLAAAAGHAGLARRLAAAVVASPLTWIETRTWARELAGAEADASQANELEAVARQLAELEDAGDWLGAAALMG